MLCCLDIRTEPIHENNVISHYRGRHSSRVEDFGQLYLMKPVPTWRTATRTVGFEVQEHPHTQRLQAGPSTMVIVPKSKEGIHSPRADRAHDAWQCARWVFPSETRGIKRLRHVNVAAEPLYMNYAGEDAEEPLEASKLVKLTWFGKRACFSSTQNSVHQR